MSCHSLNCSCVFAMARLTVCLVLVKYIATFLSSTGRQQTGRNLKQEGLLRQEGKEGTFLGTTEEGEGMQEATAGAVQSESELPYFCQPFL